MKAALFALIPIVFAATSGCAEDVSPREKDGRIAQRLVSHLERKHVLRQPFDDAMSQRAWTNLVTLYDADRAVFLRKDLDTLATHTFTIDDELKSGDVDFGFEVYKLYCRRLVERVNFATNLLAKGEWDFTTNETYTFKRDDAPWPETVEEADELWRKRMKNEVLAMTIARELDAEEEAEKAKKKAEAKQAGDEKESGEEPAEDGVSAEGEKSVDDDGKKEDDLPPEPQLTPEESLVKRYKMLAMALTQYDSETVLQTYLSAVSRSYDPHTDYMSPMTKEDFDMDMNLKLCGVGAVLSMDDGAVKIVEIMPGGPIDVDGRIKTGDKIVGVKQEDGEMVDILWQPLRKTVHKIRGEKGTRVTLEVIPRSDPTGTSRKRVELVRDEIQLDDQRTTGRVERVSIDARDLKVGYVHVPEFYGSMDRNPGDEGYVSCSTDVLEYIKTFNVEGVEGMILDLRGNGGGSLPEALRMSSLFVPSGPVVLVRDAVAAMPLQIERGNTVAFRKPLIVLIDRGSASASEIVAGHLRDVGRAIVLGDVRTHGKGTVQSVMSLGSDKLGYGSAKITTMRFYRVNGRSTQVKGVASDIHLPSFLDSLDIGEEKLPYALPFTRIKGPNYRQAWNLPDFVPKLAELSGERTAADEAFQRHVKNVAEYKALFDRTEAPLERNARKAQMKADREIRELEDGEGDDDEEKAAKARRRRKRKLDDIVLDEAFKVMGDLVRLTEGREMPPAPIDWYNAILGF